MAITTASRKKPASRSNGRAPKSTAAGRELLAAIKEVHRAVTTGDYTGMKIREVEIADPRPFDAATVRSLREKLGASVGVFALLCGVTPQLVEHWEQGRRVPAPLACRLLERIEADPSGYVGALVKRRDVTPGK